MLRSSTSTLIRTVEIVTRSVSEGGYRHEYFEKNAVAYAAGYYSLSFFNELLADSQDECERWQCLP